MIKNVWALMSSIVYDGRQYAKKDDLWIAIQHAAEIINTEKKGSKLMVVHEITIEKWTILHACCLQAHSGTAKLILTYSYLEELKRRYVSKSGLYEYYFAFDLNAQAAAGQTVIYLAVSANNEKLLDTLLHFNIQAKLIESPIQSNDSLQLNQIGSSESGQKTTSSSSSSKHVRIRPDRPKLIQTSEDALSSRLQPNSQLDKIIRQLRRLDSKDPESNSQRSTPGQLTQNENRKYLICPFEMDTYCDYNSKTALHLAVCQQYHSIATTLLVNGSNPNLPILSRDSIKSDFVSSSVGTGLNWLRSSKSTCLKEACRLDDEIINRSSTPNNGFASSTETGIGLSPNSSKMVAKFSKYNWEELQLENVKYVGDIAEELGIAGVQSEEVHDSNKNFLWHIIKQLRPGMDLSKVTLPTFILEPRSFLEKLADYYYHCDILSEAVLIDDPLMRLINIVKWYLSGFYKKPKGPKKPYNPILGERFRCFWDHPRTQSRTFFVSEQVSHHPPISAFHVSNKKDGYTMTCALLSRSKFGGNSVSAILDGKAKLYLNKRGETYTLTMPHANCRGILLGSLCLELCGKVEIECAEFDFKLAPVWATSNSYSAFIRKILRVNKVTHTLDGHWDKKINIVDKRTDKKSVLWEVTDAIRNSRLKRYTVAFDDQDERESVKLWSKVTALVKLILTTASALDAIYSKSL